MPHSLTSLLKPASIAVIGASSDTNKLGGELFHFLIEGRYSGKLLPVNPNCAEIHGIACHADIAAASTAGRVDLAIIAIPARAVPSALEQCAAAGVRNAVIISSGFAEEGGESALLQARVARIAKTTDLRVSGPNSEGFYNAIDRVSATFSPTVPRSWKRAAPIAGARRIGIVAQSGGMGFAIFDRGLAARLDFSYVITSGNEVDLTMADYVDYLVDDPDTGVIGLFCEAIRDSAGFEAAATRARRIGKPIVVLKVGQSEAGRRATASHTASIAGSGAAYEAFFARHGIISTGDIDEAMAACGLLATNPRWGAGRRALIVTPSGGAGALASDALERAGFVVPPLSEAAQAALRPKMPSYGAAGNPVDVTAQGNRAGAYVDAVQLMQGSGEVDVIVAMQSLASETRLSFDPADLARRPSGAAKPIAVYSYPLASEFARGRMAEAGFMVNTNLSAMAGAMDKIVAAAGVREREGVPSELSAAQVAEAVAGLAGSLTEWHSKRLLRTFGIEESHERLARTIGEALVAADALGYPVALKIQSAAILHKTEVGGVKVGVPDPAALRVAYDAVCASAGNSEIEGVLVQRMAPAGVEMIVGAFDDPVFGPIVMVGAGGIAVELFPDVAYRQAPLSPRGADALIRSLKSSARFEGFRGTRRIDIAPLARLVARFSQIAAAGRGKIAELELNPVIVHADGSGLTIADALIRLA